MGSVTPVRFSEAVNVTPAALRRLRVTDPLLNLDTKLFIDPMLLAQRAERARCEGRMSVFMRTSGRW